MPKSGARLPQEMFLTSGWCRRDRESGQEQRRRDERDGIDNQQTLDISDQQQPGSHHWADGLDPIRAHTDERVRPLQV